MAAIKPFQPLRPLAPHAGRVAAVPYDVVTTEEARALASGNPCSFLHVSRAEIDLPEGTDPYSETVYRRALLNFSTLRTTAPLMIEPAAAFYFYRLQMGNHRQTGLAACYSLDEYDRGLIKKHERTRPDKEDDRTRHLITLSAQTGPVFLVYRASQAMDDIAARVTATEPLFDFEAPDGVRHTMWRAAGDAVPDLVQAGAALPCLYIADGHHRAASAARARSHFAMAAGPGSREADWMLAVAFPDDQTQILPYNRVVKDLAGQSAAGLIQALEARFRLTDGGPNPVRKGEVSMYLEGRWRTLHLDGQAAGPGVGSSLDVSRLQERILEPLLKISDPRTDKRIEFVGGIRGSGELEKLVDGGKAAVAFAMYPVSCADLMRIADAGEIMPPKSTWFEPKLRDGLLVHLLD
jgi:uncharacterized protein (DUF1015 family)